VRSLRSWAPALRDPWGLAAAAPILGLLAIGGLAAQPGRRVELLALAALLAAAGWAGGRAAGALIPRAGLGSRLACAVTAAVAAVTCSATLLGHFGQLRLGPFLAAIGCCFAGSLYLRPAPLRTSTNVTAAAPAGSRPLARIERALLLAAAAALALRFGGSVVHVARDPGAFVTYDDMSYHLPVVAVWQRSGDLRTMKFETGDPSPTFYPFATELCSWALLAPLRDSDALARRVQLLFALGSLIALAAVSRQLGLSRGAALFAVLLYLTVDRAFPVLALGAGNDHATCFFTLAALDGGLLLLRRPGRGAAAYTGAALGLLIATKYIGLFFAATVLAALLVRWAIGQIEDRRAGDPRQDDFDSGGGGESGLVPAGVAERREIRVDPELPPQRPGSAGALAWHLGILGVLMVLCGGYAYARNAWTAGNPVFPAPVVMLGHRVWAGWSGASLEWRRHLPEFRIDTLSFLMRRPDLFGPLFAWTMLPAALIAPALAMARRRRRLAVVLALPIALFLEFRFLMHDHRDVRYILPALAIAGLAAAWLLATADRRLGAAVRCVILVGILLTAASHLHASAVQQAALLPLLCVLAGLAAAAAERYRATATAHRHAAADHRAPSWPRGRLGIVALLGLPAILGAAWAGGLWIDRFQTVKLAAEPAAAALDAATRWRGAHIAYVGSNEPYLFFGSRLQNDLQIVPTDGDLAAQYYFWGGSVHFPFDRPSSGQWRANLAARRIDFVVAARTADEGPERSWMAASPRDFTVLYQSPRVEIWRVVHN
jgi:hypothetical protein